MRVYTDREDIIKTFQWYCTLKDKKEMKLEKKIKKLDKKIAKNVKAIDFHEDEIYCLIVENEKLYDKIERLNEKLNGKQ
jgi:hypothetical protein